MSPAPGVDVRRLRAGEAGGLREIRLRALADAPSAFGSTLAREHCQPPGYWDHVAGRGATSARSATFVAVDGERFVGLVGSFVEEATGAAHLVSMWTAPEARGRGVGAALVRAVLDWATAAGATEVGLWVTRGNDAAVRLYERAGFTPTGAYQPLASDPCKDELRMVRPISPRPAEEQ